MFGTHWLQALIASNAHQRDVDKLAQLSDHLLADIGLRRDQLEALRLETPKAAMDRAAFVERRFGRRAEIGVRASLEGCG
jgi:hypothetical protein